MGNNSYYWLPHLVNLIPDSAKGYVISGYSIALEGWRRGLTLKFINENRRKSEFYFQLSNKNKSHLFTVSRGDLITPEAMEICRNKFETKKYLQKNKVPTPNGKLFSESSSNNEIVEYAKKIGFPLVIKPFDGTGGKGVIAGITSSAQLIKALTYVRETLGYKKIIVEEYFEGEDYRVYVVGDEAVAITKRIPANVVGDGRSTVKELIIEKNKIRKLSPILGSSLIKIDQELKEMLKKKNYTLESVPEYGEIVYLKSKNNISAGGDPVDVTDQVSEDIKQIAINSVKAIPGLPHAGVDLIVNVENNTSTVLEINTQASIRTHLFPMKGTARDVPKKIIDYYFPETKDIPIQDSIYFDMEPIFESFKNGLIKEYELPNIPSGEIEKTRFVVSGIVQGVNYGKWVRRQARNLKLNGYVKHLNNDSTSIVVLGEKDKVDQFRKIINSSSSKNAIVVKVEEKSRTTPVKLGFEIENPELDKKIEDGYYPVRLEGIYELRHKKSTKKKTVGNDDNVYKKKYNQVISSTSWKITKPVRLLGRILKKIKS